MGDLGPRVSDLLGLARAAAEKGRYAQALDPVRQILELLDGPRTTEPLGLPLLPYAEACALGGRCRAALGDQAGALEMIQRGAREAETAGHPASQLTVAAAQGRVLVLGGLAAEAIAALEPAVATARDKNLGEPLVETLRAVGPAYLLAGRAAEAIAAAQEAITRQEATEGVPEATAPLVTLGEAYAQQGDLRRAEAFFRQAQELAEQLEERGEEGWLRLAWAELALRRDDRATAEAHLNDAQDIADELALMPLVERCRALFARLRQPPRA